MESVTIAAGLVLTWLLVGGIVDEMHYQAQRRRTSATAPPRLRWWPRRRR
jgi:hypothetical protein